MAAPPQIPPRPTRAPQQSASPLNEVPKIPPRPKRAIDRSVSPNREAYARSPLNDPTFLHNGPHHYKESNLHPDVPARPPSVSLPSLGEEGMEYASFDDLSKTLSNQSESSPHQTKVAGDLPLYAPTASVPSSTAKSRIQTVTRTDSQAAIAAGLGGSLAPEGVPSSTGGSASSTGGTTRPSSLYREKEDEKHGIPEIGVQVPMYPHAGDVQAPTPSPYDQPPATGVGFFNKGDKPAPRHHGRTKSGREIFHGPPGSYGLHGHGKIRKDEFEQQWYEKHPEDFKREKAGEYGPHIQENRKEYNWESDKLDKLVRTAGTQGIGMGASGESIATPDEAIGYIATEEYASRMASPRPASGRPGSISGKTLPTAESPLRHSKFPDDALTRRDTREGEAEEDVIHIDPPSHRTSKIHGGGYDPPTEDLGPKGGNTDEQGGWVSERGYGTPILASDEIKKHGAGAEWRQPAIDPELERRASGEYMLNDEGALSKQRTHSRSSSRNAERQRFIPSPAHHDRSGTPLESTKEYEPLFPEDEQPVKPKSNLDKLKRPDLARHSFPSQDKWEDTPSSLQLETTVDTPQAEEEPETPAEASSASTFEDPAKEQARKENITKEDQQSFLPEQTKRFANKHLEKEYLSQPTRPGLKQRFPSQDIWEDTPEHMHLETTVSGPQTPDTNEYADESPVTTKAPQLPARPSVPARPKGKETSPVDKKAPVLPERPKPQIPARPSKPRTLSTEESAAAEASPQTKAKPPVPARPGGSKIAALQSGFLKDLNSKLGLGPPKVKEPEPEEEKEPPAPLTDARKGRAKGPQRRKPTSSVSPAPAATVTAEVVVPRQSLSFDIVSTVWSINDTGALEVPAAEMSSKLQAALAPSSAPSATKEHIEVVEEGEPLEKVDTAKSAKSTKSAEVGLEKVVSKGEGLDAEIEKLPAPVSASSFAKEEGERDDVVGAPAAGVKETAPVLEAKKEAKDGNPLEENVVPGGFPVEVEAGVEEKEEGKKEKETSAAGAL